MFCEQGGLPVKYFFIFLDRFLWAGSIFSMLALVAVVLLQVFARVALPVVPAWTEEASRLCFIWCVAFAAGPAVRERAYVDVDSFINHLPLRLRVLLAILIDCLLAGFTATLTYEAAKLMFAVKGHTSAALQWPMAVFYVAIWIQTLMLTIYLLQLIWRRVSRYPHHIDATEEQLGEVR